jgi:hypothetical protein
MLEESPVLGQEWVSRSHRDGASTPQTSQKPSQLDLVLPLTWNVIIPEDSSSQRSGGRVRASNFCCA